MGLYDIVVLEQLFRYRDYYWARRNPKDILKPWTSTDIARFTQEDPVHGTQIQKLRQAGMIGAAGGLGSGATGFVYAFRRGGTVNGGLVAGAICGVCSLVVGTMSAQQVTVFTHGLYAFDKHEATAAFRNWWRKNGGAQ